jgi:hypothetical protein
LCFASLHKELQEDWQSVSDALVIGPESLHLYDSDLLLIMSDPLDVRRHFRCRDVSSDMKAGVGDDPNLYSPQRIRSVTQSPAGDLSESRSTKDMGPLMLE